MSFRITPAPSGYVSQIASLSPEVIKAQRIAEIENIAKYRAIKLQKYKDWADSEKRAAMQAEAKRELEMAIQEAKFMESQNSAIFEIPEYKKLDQMIKITPFVKPVEEPKKEGLLQRITSWLK